MKSSLLTLLILSLFASPVSFASKKHKHKHGHHHHDHQLAAHVHGEVELSLISANKGIAIELKSPGESLLGFEHKPKNEEETKKVEQLKNGWQNDLLGAFTFSDSKDQCSPKEAKLHVKYEEGHSAIHAQAVLECPFSLADKKLVITLRQKYQRIEKLKIEAMPENKSPQVLELKGTQQTAEIVF